MHEYSKRGDRLRAGITHCHKCRLEGSRRHAVPGEGPLDADIVFIGEAPGVKEDAEGRPFVGDAGRFLDELLQGYGIDREEVFITSCVKCHPPGNRPPRPDELETCLSSWMQSQLALIEPSIVVLLGSVATRSLLGLDGPLSKLHGSVHQRNGRRYLVTYHPAAGMRFPKARDAMRSDLGKLGELLD